MSTPTAPVVRARHETAEGVTILACHGNICSEQTDAIVNAANERLEHGGGVAAAISTAGGPAIQAESAAWVKKHGPCTTGKVAAITSAGDLPCKKVVHVAGPIWSKPVGNELEVRGEIVSWDGDKGVLMAAECGNVRFSSHQIASGYTPEEGDRVRACIWKRPPKAPGGKTKGPPQPANNYSARFVCGAKFQAEVSDEALLEGAVTAALQKAEDEGMSSIAMPAISSGVFGFPVAQCAQIQVKCAAAMAAKAKTLKTISFTNIDIPTVTAFLNGFREAFGPASILEDVSKGEASKQLTTARGKELSGPMLIDVDSAGLVVGKQPCPPTTSTNMARIKSEGYAFHATGQYRNNWVRGMPPPGEEAAKTFDPRADWSKGYTQGVPGMDDEGGAAGAAKKKKKKKGKGGGGGGGDGDEDEKGEEGGAGQGGKEEGGKGGGKEEPASAEEVSKRIKAVSKKLRQAEDLVKESSAGKELNVDQKSKIASIPEMKTEIEKLTAALAALSPS